MKIKKADQVYLVAPGGFIKDSSVIEKAEELLQKWGLKTKKGKNILKREGRFAGTDKERLEDLQEVINDEQTKLIWALRGGYGTNRILDQLDFSPLKRSPKIIAGFSDITLIHNKMQNLGFPAWHTFMPVNLSSPIDKEVVNQTKNAFFGKPVEYHFPRSSYTKFDKSQIEGIVTGGNLAILYSALGTSWDIDTTDKILMIEDVGEALYQIDRMIISLKKAGKFDGIKALLVGQFTQIPKNDPAFGQTYQEIIQEHTKDFDFPIIFDFPSGHIQENYPIIFGKKALLKNNRHKITFLQNT